MGADQVSIYGGIRISLMATGLLDLKWDPWHVGNTISNNLPLGTNNTYINYSSSIPIRITCLTIMGRARWCLASMKMVTVGDDGLGPQMGVCDKLFVWFGEEDGMVNRKRTEMEWWVALAFGLGSFEGFD